MATQVICSANLALILDTNILLDLLEDSGSNNFLESFTKWLRETVEQAECRSIENRSVTLVVTSSMVKEYRTGVGKRHLDSALIGGLELLMQKATGTKLSIPSQKGHIFLTPFKVIPGDYGGSHSKHDPKDKKVFAMCESVETVRRLKDRKIVISSRDEPTADGLEREFYERIPVVRSKEKLSEWIWDP